MSPRQEPCGACQGGEEMQEHTAAWQSPRSTGSPPSRPGRCLPTGTPSGYGRGGMAPPEPPQFWKDAVNLGWLGLQLAEEDGGQGFGVPELAILAEELGRVVAPGPFLPTAPVAAVIADPGQRRGPGPAALLSAWAPVTVVVTPATFRWKTGEFPCGQLPGGQAGLKAQLLLVPVGAHLAVVRPGDAVTVTLGPRHRRQPKGVRVSLLRRGSRGDVARQRAGGWILGRTLPRRRRGGRRPAEAEAAVAYAKTASSSSRPVGSFQAVKHMCGHARRGGAGDGGRVDAARGHRGSPGRSSRPLSPRSRSRPMSAELSIQVHGGIGFTWEHDYLYLRRARCHCALRPGARRRTSPGTRSPGRTATPQPTCRRRPEPTGSRCGSSARPGCRRRRAGASGCSRGPATPSRTGSAPTAGAQAWWSSSSSSRSWRQRNARSLSRPERQQALSKLWAL